MHREKTASVKTAEEINSCEEKMKREDLGRNLLCSTI